MQNPLRDRPIGPAFEDDQGTFFPEKIYAYVTDGVRDVVRMLETQAEDAEDEEIQGEIVAGLNLMQANGHF